MTRNWHEPLDWTAPPGRLAYIALPPGAYVIDEARFARQSAPPTLIWSTGKDGTVTPNNPGYGGFSTAQYRSMTVQSFAVPFEIVAGQATYIGNLHFIWHETEQVGEVVVRNRAERDLALLRQRLPGVDTARIRLKVPRRSAKSHTDSR